MIITNGEIAVVFFKFVYFVLSLYTYGLLTGSLVYVTQRQHRYSVIFFQIWRHW
jgi:hypothetical protein